MYHVPSLFLANRIKVTLKRTGSIKSNTAGVKQDSIFFNVGDHAITYLPDNSWPIEFVSLLSSNRSIERIQLGRRLF